MHICMYVCMCVCIYNLGKNKLHHIAISYTKTALFLHKFEMHPCYNYISILISCSYLLHYNITQTAPNIFFPIHLLSKIIELLYKVFCKVVTTCELLSTTSIN